MPILSLNQSFEVSRETKNRGMPQSGIFEPPDILVRQYRTLASDNIVVVSRETSLVLEDFVFHYEFEYSGEELFNVGVSLCHA